LLAQCPVMGGGVAALCALIYKIPLFVELHGTHYFMPSRQGVLGRLEHIIYRTLAKPVFTIATAIRSLSGDMTSSFVQVYGKKLLPKIVMIPVRVDLNIFPPKENYKLHQPLRVVNVGKLSANKNQIQLVNHLKNSKMPIEIILVGSGEQEADLKSLISTLPSHLKVTLKGQVTHVELCDILQQSDIFIHYALSEGTPRAIIVAMAV
ncbi:glycosyltransferase, partial [Rhizobium hidalgonense]